MFHGVKNQSPRKCIMQVGKKLQTFRKIKNITNNRFSTLQEIVVLVEKIP
jgi:hypothetical protein